MQWPASLPTKLAGTMRVESEKKKQPNVKPKRELSVCDGTYLRANF